MVREHTRQTAIRIIEQSHNISDAAEGKVAVGALPPGREVRRLHNRPDLAWEQERAANPLTQALPVVVKTSRCGC